MNWAGTDYKGAASPAPLTPSQGRRIAFALFVLALFGGLCAPLLVDNVQHHAGTARNGVIDFSWTNSIDRPVTLGGDWRFDWQSQGADNAIRFMHVPGPWSGDGPAGQVKFPARGMATYSATIKGLPSGRYTVFVPPIYGASEVRVNGEPASVKGRVAPNPVQTVYFVQAHRINFSATGSDVRLAITVGTGAHRDSGIENAPILGRESAMVNWLIIQICKNVLFSATMLVIAIFSVIVFIYRPSDRSPLYLASCLIFFVPIQLIFSHDNLLVDLFPNISFRGMESIQYLCGVPALSFMFCYVAALFPKECPRALVWFINGSFGLLFLGLAIFAVKGDTLLASEFSTAVEPFRLFVLLCMAVIAIAACMRKRDGSAAFVVGFITLLASILVRLMISNAMLKSDAVTFDPSTFGIMAFLLSQTVILAERWSVATLAAEQTAAELRELLEINTAVTNEMQLEKLLEKIVFALTRMIRADRSSLFLFDAATNELWSLVAEGVTGSKIRFAADTGLAGLAFQSGELLNVADAYDHPHFNDDVDLKTGIRTHAIVSVPIITRDGRRLGVMQALNQRESTSFSDRDVARIRAFAAQAAIAIDNATLFSEVLAERNYNESILRSMSSGVITLDADARVVKLNNTACRMLGLEQNALEDTDVRALLAQHYPLLVEEIDLVASTGMSRDIVDFDLVTFGRNAISVNISMVPLRMDAVAAGVLIILEDISEGKRLQSTMRRFMSQEVVDQVLQRDGELLFGSACAASILFCDIRNFTTMSEHLDPRQTVGMLNELFTELFEDITLSGGILDKYIGDAIMATFGAPLNSAHDPENAARCAVLMQDTLVRVNRRRIERAEECLRLGIGIATGRVVAGTIGSPKRMEYTVIGDSVNLASRLQDLTKVYGVAIIGCENTAHRIRHTHTLRELDLIRVRGRRGTLTVHQVLGASDAARDTMARVCALYAVGRQHLFETRWSDAARAFGAARALDPDDRPSAIMLERAEALANAPPTDWDNVWPPRHLA